MVSDAIFVCLVRLYETAKCLMAILCLAKMREKIYMFKENIFIINAKDQGILATSNHVPFRITLMTCSPHADHWGNSHHFFTFDEISKTPKLLVRETTGSSKVSSRGLIPFSNNYHRII